MDLKEPEAEPQFSQPNRQIVSMLVVLALVGGGVWLAFPRVGPVFLANPYFNGFIAVVFVIGVLSCFGQVFALMRSVRWIEGFATQRLGHDLVKPPPLLTTLGTLLKSRGARSQLSPSSSRSILDSVAQRIDEDRGITRYIINTLIFLGLLGTFYGLATTVPALVDTIRSLDTSATGDALTMFDKLRTGLESQLGGMGVAFASSLLGLAGSLVVGLLELFASHGQNRFYRELENWLSTITRVGFSDGEQGGEQGVMAAVVDHLTEQVEALQLMFTQSDMARAAVDERLGEVAAAVEGLTAKLGAGQETNDLLVRVVEGQERLLAKLNEEGIDGIDAESRMRLRSIDVGILRLLEELAAGREETLSALRGDIAALARAVRQSQKVAAQPVPRRPAAPERQEGG